MTRTRAVLAVAGAALAVRVARSRHRRFLHPAGRSFAGDLEIHDPEIRDREIRAARPPVGSDLLDRPARHRATVRLSKGAGTRGGRLDVRGLAVRVHRPDRDLDLLLSTVGRGPLTRYLPALRRSFETTYGSITAYRTRTGTRLFLTARPDPDGPVPGRALDDVSEGDRFLLRVRLDGAEHTVGRVTLGRPLPSRADAALAFDPVRNSAADLHPTGLVHGVRALAYRLSQRWRGVSPAPANPRAVARTGGHR